MKKIMVLVLVLLVLAAPMAAMARDDSGDDNSGRDGGSDDSGSGGTGPTETETLRGQEVETRETVTGTVTPHEAETEHGAEVEVEHGIEVETEHGTEIEQEHTNATELRDQIREQETASATELEREGIRDAVVRENQGTFLVGIDTFRLVRELNDTQGRTLSEIETEIENSVRVTSQAESRIRSRNAVVRLFVGGDDQAAQELERERNQTELRIAEMNQLIDSCTTCSDQVKDLLRERISEMEQEQERLHEVASRELASQGIIGWIWK